MFNLPNKTENISYVYTISNGSVFEIAKTKPENVTNYNAANVSCQARGGYLAIIDTQLKQDNLTDLVKEHLVAFTTAKGIYLLGKLNKIILYFFRYLWPYVRVLLERDGNILKQPADPSFL